MLIKSIIDTNFNSRLVNDQSEGVARLLIDNNYLVINNLGKNIEYSQLALKTKKLQPLKIYDFSYLASLNDESQFDIDMHSILKHDENIVCINHYGIVRVFQKSSNFQPIKIFKYAGDTEYNLLINSQIISTSSNAYALADPNTNGIIVSDSINTIPNNYYEENFNNVESYFSKTQKINYQIYLAELGKINNIAYCQTKNLFAFTTNDFLYLYQIEDSSGINFSKLIFKQKINFIVKYIKIEDDHILFAGIENYLSDSIYDDYFESSEIRPSIIKKIDITGKTIWQKTYNNNIAWGYGGSAVVIEQNHIYLALRNAELLIVDYNTGDIYNDLNHSSNDCNTNYGTANLYKFNSNTLICTFNRIGYKMILFELDKTIE